MHPGRRFAARCTLKLRKHPADSYHPPAPNCRQPGLVSPPDALSARCASGKHFTHAVLTVRKSATPVVLPSPGHTTIAFDTGDVEFLYSADDGATFTPVHAEAFFRYELKNIMVSGYSLFDTEMLQLEFSGGTMPAGMRLRESPTLPSKGRTSLRALPDGQFLVDSFFDVFTELSLDDGRTWEPFDQPLFYQFEDCPIDQLDSRSCLAAAGTLATDAG